MSLSAMTVVMAERLIYVHFTSDVLAAAVLGVVIGLLAFRCGMRVPDGRPSSRGLR